MIRKSQTPKHSLGMVYLPLPTFTNKIHRIHDVSGETPAFSLGPAHLCHQTIGPIKPWTMNMHYTKCMLYKSV